MEIDRKNIVISTEQVVNQLHTNYMRQVSLLMQENAEMNVQLQQLLGENLELKAKLEALTDDDEE